jgi:hypothetical protein
MQDHIASNVCTVDTLLLTSCGIRVNYLVFLVVSVR